ncbi:Small glutamine-rich tetratricopeptide repeat-containing protein 2 [Cladobotryum mycophilum]|uniref:Small glutamine-rich tetratricopeptide repeat-containing protein 2 n=1 Tax=Cladobotryum mycophilum TaxID=491253 RepID=A0ABR0SXB0_9HYPO
MDADNTNSCPSSKNDTEMPFPSLVRQSTTAVDRSDDSLRRCFICLTDEEPTDPKGSWVDPCPCTLEAHQDCMLSWVTDCERSNKPLQCPVCKAPITLEGPWDPIASLHDAFQKKFTKASPFILLTGMSVGVQFSLQMYGAVALWTFAGKEELIKFMFGPDMPVDGRGPGVVKFAKQRVMNALVLMNVAPTLLVSQLLPGLSNKYFMQSASIYGVFTMIRDENFLTWPPSPRLAMVALPIIRRMYWNFWKDFVLPYEVKLNRQIMGLPPLDSSDAPAARNNRPNPQRQGEGGFIGLLQNILDVLDPDEEEHIIGNNHIAAPRVHQEIHVNEQGDDGDIMVELVVEEFEEEEEMNGQNGAAQEQQDHRQHQGPAHAVAGEQQRPAGQHEAPQAPPARRLGLGGLLSNVSNSIVSALLLPGISYAMGEALRLILPRSWTATPRNPLFARMAARPGLLQQQWGRSLVGGCLYIVLNDVLRLYSKSRKVAAMNNRRVKNASQQSSKQRLALAICDFLSTSSTDGTLTAEDKDSIDVAINCIAESFKIDPADTSALQAAIGSQSLLQIYSVYEKLKSSNTSSSSSSAAPSSSVPADGVAGASAPPPASNEPSDAQKKEAEGLKSKGNAAMAQKDYASAIDLYTQALGLHPTNAVFLSNRAAAHSANKDHGSARIDAEAAVAVDPSYTKAWSRLGLARFALGDPKGAMDAYRQGIEHEGNGGSEAMKKGFETAKRRVEELESDQDNLSRSAPGGGAPGGGMPDLASLAGMFGGGGAGAGGAGGAGGMPDLGSIMSNPMFASMAQNLMSNPDLMNNLMSNPRLREMANQFGSGGGMPDLGALMSDPNIADMARNMMGGNGGAPGGPPPPR